MNFLRKYNTATAAGTHIRIPIIKAGSNDFAINTDWTPAAGDVKLSKDGGAEANIGTLPTYSNGAWEFQLTGAELSAKTIHCKIVDSATKVIEDQFFIIETFGNASAMYPTDWSVAHAQQTGDNYTRLGAPAGGSHAADVAAVKAETAGIKAKTDLIPAGGPPSATDYTPSRAAKLDNADVATSSRLATAGYTAPNNAGIASAAADAATAATQSTTAASQATTAASQATTAATQSTAANAAAAAVKVVTDKLATAIEPDSSVHRFTANALEMAPGGGGGALSPDQDAALTRIDRTVKGLAARRE